MRVKILRYAMQGLGYAAWTPEDGKGLPSLWFNDLIELRAFANKNGYKLSAI